MNVILLQTLFFYWLFSYLCEPLPSPLLYNGEARLLFWSHKLQCFGGDKELRKGKWGNNGKLVLTNQHVC